MTFWPPLLPPVTRDAITRQDDRLRPELLLKASQREVHGRSYALLATAVATAVAAILLVGLLIVDYFFRR